MSDSNTKNDSVVLKGEEHLLLDHNYDGIQELDHVLPRWWLWILYGTIAFSAAYVGYYMIGTGPNQNQELAADISQIEKRKPIAPAGDGSEQQAQMLAALKDEAKLKEGHEVYVGKCLACHGDKGQGLVGPNLTDDHWIHGQGTMADVATVVANGVSDKGMPPWGAVLQPQELVNVVAFVRSLHGTNPSGAKEPQGQKYEIKD